MQKFKTFKKKIKFQRKLYFSYQDFFKKNDITGYPLAKKNDGNAYSQFTMLVNKRKKLIKYFNKYKIPFKIYYPTPLYKQYNLKNYNICKNTEKICKNVISLPFNYLDKKRHENIIYHLRKIINLDRKIFFEKR